MHDRSIEERLRSTLRSEADALPLTITAEELDRRLSLRRRDRMNRRFGLLAAGVAAIAVTGVFALAVGPFRGPDVAATPRPSVTPSALAASPPVPSGPLDPREALPVLEPSVDAVDFHGSEQVADLASTDATPEITSIDGVRMNARTAGIRFVCAGPDVAEITWGYPFETQADYTAIAKETVMCDSVVREFRYDIAARQPLVDDLMTVVTSRRVSFRILVESFGFTNDPRPTELPDVAIPRGTVVADVKVDAGIEPTGSPGMGRAGSVPPRQAYRVAMVCLGTGTAHWTIGAEDSGDFVAAGGVPCDGAALGFSPSPGLPSADSTVYVTTDPGNSWHLVITDPLGPPPFIPPAVEMFAGVDLEGPPTSAPAHCVGWDDHVDSCGLDLSPRDGAHVVGVPTDSDLGIVVGDGWTVTDAGVKLADRDAVRTDPTRAEVTEFASLEDGSGRLESGAADRLTLHVAGIEPGEWIVIVTISAENGGHTFGATYQMPLRIGG